MTHELYGKHVYMLRFLPYLETVDGRRVEDVLSLPKRRGYGYGSIEEVYQSKDEATSRMEMLLASGCIERLEMISGVLGRYGETLLEFWEDKPNEN